ncbi:MAG TPA: BlaI/MecI/CopY family transcriptional regulator [Candidatus Baltobacteraceae bacterium]|nr:BlaI/MecI/CopY family transcriptional regulator [Candidatus Baltobacteraceae bacterium]
MPRKKALVLTDHELRLMDVLWEKGRATVSEVTAALEPPPLAYNTVLSTMRTLEQKGYVGHEETGRAFTYLPLVKRDDAAKSAVSHVLARFFANSPNALAVTLLDDVPLREADRKAIRDLLERKPKGRK